MSSCGITFGGGDCEVKLDEYYKAQLVKALGQEKADEIYQKNSKIQGGDDYRDDAKFKAMLEYDASVKEGARKNLVKDVAKMIADMAPSANINPDEKDLRKLSTKLVEVLPDPKMGKHVKADSKIQVALCKKIGEMINSHLDENLVDLKKSEDDICRQVVSLLGAFGLEMRNEFAAVHFDIRERIKNITALKNAFMRSLDCMAERISEGKSSDTERSAYNAMRADADKIAEYMERQIGMLKALVDVTITKEQADIDNILRDYQVTRDKFGDRHLKTPSQELGEFLSRAMMCVATSAQIVAKVSNSMHKLKLDEGDFRGKSLSDMEEKLNKLIKESHTKTDGEFADLIKAAEKIKRYFGLYKQIKGLGETSGGSDNVEGGLNLDVRIKKREADEKAIFSYFNKELGKHFEKLVSGTEAFAKRLGRGLKMTDTLRGMIKTFVGLDDIKKVGVHRALTGYDNTVDGRKVRDQYMAGIKMLLSYIKKMQEMSEYSEAHELSDMSDALSGMVSMIDLENERFTSKGYGKLYGGTLGAPRNAADIAVAKMTNNSGVTVTGVQTRVSSFIKLVEALKDNEAVLNLQKDNQGPFDTLLDDNLGKESAASLIEKIKNLGVDATPANNSTVKKQLRPYAEGLLGQLDQDQRKILEQLFIDLNAPIARDDNDRIIKTINVVGMDSEINNYDKNVINSYLQLIVYLQGISTNYTRMDTLIGRIRNNGCAQQAAVVANPATGAVATPTIDVNPIWQYLAILSRLNVANAFAKANNATADFDFGTNDNDSDVGYRKMLLEAQRLKDLYESPKYKVLYGGAYLDDKLPLVSKAAIQLDKVVNDLQYYAKISNIRNNLSQTAGELDYYGEEYKEVLADAIAGRRQAIKNERARVKDELERACRPGGDVYRWCDVNKGTKTVEECCSQFQNNVLGQFDTKDNFYIALEAIDTYLKEFTNLFAKHPDDVKELQQILSGLETITQWYNNKTGDELAKLFDMFPYTVADQPAGTAFPAIVNDKKEYKADARNGVPADVEAADYYQKFKSAQADLTTTFNLPGVPQNVVPPGEKFTAMKQQARVVLNNFAVLKNVLSAFFNVGDKLGSEEVKSRLTFSSPRKIYSALMDFLVNSSFQHGWQAGTVQLDYYNATIKNGNPIGTETFPAGLPSQSGAQYNTLLRKYGITMASPEFQGPDNRSFEEERKLFAHVLKAMAAKVFSVIGAFNLFERPAMAASISPTRMILGGAAPDVNRDAVELYVRLPLLAEFYRDIFEFSTNTNVDRISMFPETDSVFAGLVHLVFRKRPYVNEAQYSESDVADIVREVNMIYEKYKREHPDNPCHSAIMGLVHDINRRYGLVKRDDFRKYNELYNRKDASGDLSDIPLSEFSVLPDEDEALQKSVNPSDVLLEGGPLSRKTFESKYSLNMWSVVKDFRDKISKKIEKDMAGNDNKRVFSFTALIRETQSQLDLASRADERLEILTKALRGSKDLARGDSVKALMFHETVVLGLDQLYRIYVELERLRLNMNGFTTPMTDAEYEDLSGYLVHLCGDSQGLIRLQNDDRQLSIDFSNISNHASSLFDHVKDMFEKLKFSMDSSKLKEYTDKTKPGSLYYIEEKLINGLLKGMRADGAYDETLRIDHVNKVLKEKRVGNLPAGNPYATNNVFFRLLYFNENQNRPVGKDTAISDANKVLNAGVTGIYRLLGYSASGGKILVNAEATLHIDTQSHVVQAKDGLVMKFNSLLYNYLTLLTDQTSSKMYIKGIESFSAGRANEDIYDSTGASHLVDLAANAAPVLPLRVGGGGLTYISYNKNKILLSSLAMIMQEVISRRDPRTNLPTKQFVTLSDVPSHIREKILARAPYYIRYFSEINNAAEVIKRTLHIHRDTDQVPATDIANYTQTIEKLQQFCGSLVSNIREMLNEMNDSPQFGEVRRGAIDGFKSQTNKLPIALLSQSLSTLAKATAKIPTSDPTIYVNDPGLEQLLYSNRAVLAENKEIQASSIQLLKNNLSQYNNKVQGPGSIDEAKYMDFVQEVSKSLRYSYDKHIRQFLEDQVPAVTDDATANTRADNIKPYPIQANVDAAAVLRITESQFNEEQIKSLVEKMAAYAKAGNSDDFKTPTANIIDLDIVPINIHALMRDIPLANTYNYSYTFDVMLKNVLKIMDNSPNNDAARKFIYDFLKNPNKLITDDDMRGWHNLCAGLSDLEMGRPKFISDQLKNKVLLNSWVQTEQEYSSLRSYMTSYGVGIGDEIDSNIPAGFYDDLITDLTGNFGNAKFDYLTVGGVSAKKDTAVNAGKAPAVINQNIGNIYLNLSGITADDNDQKKISSIINALANGLANELDGDNVAFTITTAANNITATCIIPQLNSTHEKAQAIKQALLGSRANHLRYAKRQPEAVRPLDVPVPISKTRLSYLRAVGGRRLNTYLVRNMIFLTLMHKVINYKLRQDLAYQNSRVVDSYAITSESLMDFQGDETLDEDLPNRLH